MDSFLWNGVKHQTFHSEKLYPENPFSYSPRFDQSGASATVSRDSHESRGAKLFETACYVKTLFFAERLFPRDQFWRKLFTKNLRLQKSVRSAEMLSS